MTAIADQYGQMFLETLRGVIRDELATSGQIARAYGSNTPAPVYKMVNDGKMPAVGVYLAIAARLENAEARARFAALVPPSEEESLGAEGGAEASEVDVEQMLLHMARVALSGLGEVRSWRRDDRVRATAERFALAVRDIEEIGRFVELARGELSRMRESVVRRRPRNTDLRSGGGSQPGTPARAGGPGGVPKRL